MKPLPFAVFDEFGVPADDRVQDYGYACAAAEREAIASMFDAEHERRKHIDNYAACAAVCIRARGQHE